MRSQSFIILAAAAFMGLLAVIIANTLMDTDQAPVQQPAQTAGVTDVVVAKVPLFFGTQVKPEQLKIVKWPADAVPPGTFRSIAELTTEQRVALRAMEMNEPVLASKVSGKGGRLSLSGLISPDKRAATIRVNDVIGVAGFVLPGDRVDVMITRTPAGDNLEPITDILLQNVRVVAVGQDANETKDKPAIVNTATLEVSQADAQKLVLAEKVGSLSLALRNLNNMTPDRARTVRVADLRDGANSAAGTRPQRVVYRTRQIARGPVQPPRMTVQIVRGVQASDYAVRSYAGL